ncbi:hypothetical protein BC835DRAFT_1296050 [Cytidiella melzeri]|nr:hypothetical protein BC835DRAFT_1296050 [Cytidiella melzeri]
MSESRSDANGVAIPDKLQAHEVRITTHGKMKAWVEFALDFFEKNEVRPLTFHTQPAKARPRPPEADTDLPDEPAWDAPAPADQQNPKKQERMPPSLLLVPRLVSVVEIIKREYLKKLDMAGKGCLSGLYQYNELGNIAPPDGEDTETDPQAERARSIAIALKGKNYPKLTKRNACMKVTLCRTQLRHLATKQAITYQKPNVHKLSKSAKARAKKRLQREQPQPSDS